ncbi:MAG: hypothetical protein AMR96_05540 [Candidatus Adiutrix intracellularis]|nr:MAG: hypothetical protein AMR96_05540 [Candidatus Adiutrix intracellularis]
MAGKLNRETLIGVVEEAAMEESSPVDSENYKPEGLTRYKPVDKIALALGLNFNLIWVVIKLNPISIIKPSPRSALRV